MKAACRASCRPVSSAPAPSTPPASSCTFTTSVRHSWKASGSFPYRLVPLPLSGRVDGVWFEIPLPIQAARNIIGGQGMLIDLGNVYVALRAQIKGDPVSVLLWNVSTQPWHDLSQCGTEITPLANHTVLLVCSSSNATYSLALVGFDQRTGVAFPGRVSLPGDTTFYSFDSSNNLFACWANNEGKGTVCAKQPLAPCLYTDTGCTIA